MWGDRLAVRSFKAGRLAWWRYPVGVLVSVAVLVAWIATHRHPWPWGFIWVFLVAVNLWLSWVAYRLARQPDIRELDREGH